MSDGGELGQPEKGLGVDANVQGRTSWGGGIRKDVRTSFYITTFYRTTSLLQPPSIYPILRFDHPLVEYNNGSKLVYALFSPATIYTKEML
jgi:hypothetical protein